MTARGLRAAGAALAAALLAALLLLGLVVRPVRVHGASMAPALRPGDVLLVLVWPGAAARARPGAVVLADAPAPGGLTRRRVLKRVARIREGPGGPLFDLLGDRRRVSRDSRDYGPLARERLRGLVLLRLYPRPGPVPAPPRPAGR